jgi:hypothetical protein
VHADLWSNVQPTVCSVLTNVLPELRTLQSYLLPLQSELRTLLTHRFVLSLRAQLQPYLQPFVRAVL